MYRKFIHKLLAGLLKHLCVVWLFNTVIDIGQSTKVYLTPVAFDTEEGG